MGSSMNPIIVFRPIIIIAQSHLYIYTHIRGTASARVRARPLTRARVRSRSLVNSQADRLAYEPNYCFSSHHRQRAHLYIFSLYTIVCIYTLTHIRGTESARVRARPLTLAGVRSRSLVNSQADRLVHEPNYCFSSHHRQHARMFFFLYIFFYIHTHTHTYAGPRARACAHARSRGQGSVHDRS